MIVQLFVVHIFRAKDILKGFLMLIIKVAIIFVIIHLVFQLCFIRIIDGLINSFNEVS